MAELQFAIARAAQHETAQGQGRRGVIPAPVQGWNSNDPEAAMEPIYAIHCENYFPERGRVASRRGSTDYATLPVTGNPVETLATVVNGSTEKLYAFTSASVYDVSNPAAVTEDVSLGITEGRWRGATMNGHGIFVNGTDAPLTVDATNTWVAHGWTGTGLTASNLTQLAVHKNRVFFTEKDSANLWYGDLSAITGPLNKFNLGLVNAAGGNAMAVGSLSLDTGAGIDDLLVICMSRGHVLVYAGNDPSTISDWQLAGIFHLGAVIGDRPLVKLGGDLIAITADGYIPLLQFLGAGREQRQLAISDKIAPDVTAAVRLHGALEGWQPILHSEANWLLFNVPNGPNTWVQHVQNVQTGAWCLFTGMDAHCWETYQGAIYYGAAGGLIRTANHGTTDGGTSIRGVVRSAYNYMQSPYDKQFRLLRAHLESGTAGTQVQLGISVDFDRSLPPLSPGTVEQAGTAWDTAAWDSFVWSSGRGRFRSWRGVAAKGAAMSVYLGSFTTGEPIHWFSTDVVYDQVVGAISETG